MSKLSEGDSIKLPSKHIVMKYFHIPYSIKILGWPETVLEITGAILIGSFKASINDWSTINSELDDNILVHFWELEIQFSPPDLVQLDTASNLSTHRDNNSEKKPQLKHSTSKRIERESLFIIDSMNYTFLELRDCNIKLNDGLRSQINTDYKDETKRFYVCSSIDLINDQVMMRYLREQTNQADLDFGQK